MWGNIKSDGPPSMGTECGFEVDVADGCVVLEGISAASVLTFDMEAGIGFSFARTSNVSAATMPPIECPTRMV